MQIGCVYSVILSKYGKNYLVSESKTTIELCLITFKSVVCKLENLVTSFAKKQLILLERNFYLLLAYFFIPDTEQQAHGGI